MNRIRHLSTTARVSANYEHDEVGYNYRMTNVQAAIGCGQLDRLDSFLAAKRRIRARYNAAFAGEAHLGLFTEPEDRTSTCWFSGLVLDPAHHPSVKDLCERLRAMGIEARPFWMPVHIQRPYQTSPCGNMPVTSDIWHRILTLPCSTSLLESDQERVIDAVRQVLDLG